jgi:carboxylesterase type B
LAIGSNYYHGSLYGGWYNGGSKENNNPAGLLKQSGNSIIFVAPNYRVGIMKGYSDGN